MHAALAQLARLTAETAKTVADVQSKTKDLHQGLNAHSQLIEQHHRALKRLTPQEQPT